MVWGSEPFWGGNHNYGFSTPRNGRRIEEKRDRRRKKTRDGYGREERLTMYVQRQNFSNLFLVLGTSVPDNIKLTT